MIITTAGATALRRALTLWMLDHTAPGPDFPPDFPPGFRELFARYRIPSVTPRIHP